MKANALPPDRKSTRLNSSHVRISYAVFCLKKKNQSKGPNSLTSPLVLVNLITYRGFKEMLFVVGIYDNIYSIYAALNRLLCKTHFDYKVEKPKASSTAVCPGGMTATPAIMG